MQKADLMGKPVFALLPALCERNPEIAVLHFETYIHGAHLWDRLRNQDIPDEIGTQAERLSQESLLTAWHYFADLSLKAGNPSLSQALIGKIIDHPSSPPIRAKLSREDVLAGKIESTFETLPSDQGISLCSRVTAMSDQTLFIPMMDFCCSVSDHATATIEEFSRALDLRPAAIISSGTSYHLYGLCLLNMENWLKFMAKSLLFSPVTDSRYIAHRLFDIDGRLKMRSNKGRIPTIINVIT